MNLFDKAKKNETPKSAKNDKTTVSNSKLEKSLLEIIDIDEQIAALQAKRTELDTEIRVAGKNAMISKYNEEKSFPGTIVMDAGSAQFQFITSDKYIVIDEEQATYLKNKYGDQIVTEDTTFAFNPKILVKYQDEISNMIMKSKLPESAKEELIVSTTKRAVTKGTIKNLRNTDYAKFDLEEVIEDIRPIFSVKGISEK